MWYPSSCLSCLRAPCNLWSIFCNGLAIALADGNQVDRGDLLSSRNTCGAFTINELREKYTRLVIGNLDDFQQSISRKSVTWSADIFRCAFHNSNRYKGLLNEQSILMLAEFTWSMFTQMQQADGIKFVLGVVKNARAHFSRAHLSFRGYKIWGNPLVSY